jgi:hypothetical protein
MSGRLFGKVLACVCVALFATQSLAASDRAAPLYASIAADTPLVPGVDRGWAGDPTRDNWVTR